MSHLTNNRLLDLLMTHPVTLSVPFLCSLLLNASAAGQIFDESVELSDSIRQSEHVTYGDLDGDGAMELIVCPYNRNGIQILESSPGGSFRFQANLLEDYGDIPRAVPADLDGDGDLDLIFADRGSSFWDLYALENVEGDLSNSTPVFMYDVPGFFNPMVVADLTGDGRDDVILLSFTNRAVISGGIGAAASAMVLPDLGTVVQAADVDGDSVIDLVYADGAGVVSLLPGTGSGQFGSPVTFPALTSFPGRSVFYDMDGDGDLDALVAERGGNPDNATELFLQTSPFQFTQSVSFLIAPGLEAEAVYLGDVDGDGDEDVIVESRSSTSSTQWELNVFPRSTAGSWPTSALITLPSPFPTPKVYVDLNQDGFDDIFFTHSTSIQEHKVAFNESQGSTLAFTDRRDPSGDLPLVASYALGDFDLDGDPDFVAVVSVTFAAPADLVFVENLGNGRFADYAFIKTISAPPAPGQSFDWRLESGDFNGDGSVDLLLARSLTIQGALGPAELQVLNGDGAGSFSDPVTVLQVTSDNSSRFVGSLFGGGYDDLMVREEVPGGSEFRIYPNLRTGQSGFSTGGQSFFVPDMASARFADVDSDGRLDVVIWTRFGAVYHRQLAGGVFAAAIPLTDISFAPQFDTQIVGALAVGDVDGDGDMDVLHRSGRDAAGLALGTVPGRFAPTQPIDVPISSTGIELVDVDLDGHLDLVGISVWSVTSCLMRGDGTGSFAAPEACGTWGVGSPKNELFDLDMDGDLDVVRQLNYNGLDVVINATRRVRGESACGDVRANSTGLPARVTAYGSTSHLSTDLHLRVSSAPATVPLMFVCSQAIGNPVMLPGSEGLLCLQGAIGRYSFPGEIQVTSPSGVAQLPIDPVALRAPNGSIAAAPGESWFFQAWFRDASPAGVATSNLTDALLLTFD